MVFAIPTVYHAHLERCKKNAQPLIAPGPPLCYILLSNGLEGRRTEETMTTSRDSLLPSVERRLAAWLSVKDRATGAESHRPGPTITISRKYGCDAFPLALRLKELLDAACEEPWIIYDKALLERVSQAEHLSMQFLEDLGSTRVADDSLGFIFPGHVTHDEAFRRLACTWCSSPGPATRSSLAAEAPS